MIQISRQSAVCSAAPTHTHTEGEGERGGVGGETEQTKQRGVDRERRGEREGGRGERARQQREGGEAEEGQFLFAIVDTHVKFSVRLFEGTLEQNQSLLAH